MFNRTLAGGIMALPIKIKTFDFDFTSSLGNNYKGVFTVKCLLNIGEKHQMELEKTRLMGNYSNPTDELYGIATVLANLRAKLIDAPGWWKDSRAGAALEEEDLLSALYNKVLEAENQWMEDLRKQTDKTATPAAADPVPTSPSTTP